MKILFVYTGNASCSAASETVLKKLLASQFPISMPTLLIKHFIKDFEIVDFKNIASQSIAKKRYCGIPTKITSEQQKAIPLPDSVLPFSACRKHI